VSSDTQILMEPLKAAGPLERISDNPERPAFSNNRERPSHGTYLFVYIFPFHFGTVLRSAGFGKTQRKKKPSRMTGLSEPLGAIIRTDS